jgi:hypothetical protein
MERIHAGLARARREEQRLGRRRERISGRDLERVQALSVREAAKVIGVAASHIHRAGARLRIPPARLQRLGLIRWVQTLRASVSEPLVSETAARPWSMDRQWRVVSISGCRHAPRRIPHSAVWASAFASYGRSKTPDRAGSVRATFQAMLLLASTLQSR